MIDSHAHVAMFPREERGGVLQRAEDAGVRLVLVPATGPEDFDEVRRVVQERPERTVAAMGFHPHESAAFDAGWKRRLEGALEEDGVVAVGEIGLDYHYDSSPREDQRAALRWQLELARERGLPVVLHHREAWDDFLAILDAVPGVAGVAHSFTEGAAGVAAMMDRGLHVGISGMVTFPRGTTSARRPGPCPPAGCWWRRTARSWPRCPTAASRTSRLGCHWLPRQSRASATAPWPRSRPRPTRRSRLCSSPGSETRRRAPAAWPV